MLLEKKSNKERVHLWGSVELPSTSSILTQWFVVTIVLLALVGCGEKSDPKKALENGIQFLETGNGRAAIAELKTAVQGAPDNPNARYSLGKAHLLVGDFDAGLKELVRASELGMNSKELHQEIVESMIKTDKVELAAKKLQEFSDPSDSTWQLLQGQLDRKAGRYSEAIEVLSNSLKQDDTNIQTHEAIVGTALDAGKFAEALTYVEQGLAVFPDDFSLWVFKGDISAKLKNHDEAQLAYSEALKIEPINTEAIFKRATSNAALLKSEQALADLALLPEKSQKTPTVLNLKGVIALNDQNYEQAVDYFNEVLNSAPNNIRTIEYLSIAHFQAGNYLAAEEQLEHLVALQPDNIGNRRRLAVAQLAMGRVDVQSQELQGIATGALDNVRIADLLGTNFIKHGRLEEANDILQRALELTDDDYIIRVKLAYAKILAGNISEGTKNLEALWTEQPNSQLTGMLLSQAYVSSNDFPAATKAITRMLDSSPKDPQILNFAGNIYIQMNETQTAESLFTRALEFVPDNYAAKLSLARLSANTGQIERTRELLNEVLVQVPNEPTALMHLAELAFAEDLDKKGVDLWRKAAGENPTAVAPRIMLSRRLRDAGDVLEASKFAEEAYRVAAYDPDVQMEYAANQIALGNTALAVPPLETLINRYPDFGAVLKLLEDAYTLQGDNESFDKLVDQLMKKRPSAVQPRLSKYRSYFTKQDFPKARIIANGLADNPKTRALGLGLLGDIDLNTGQLNEAEKHYRAAHELNPTPVSFIRLEKITRRQGKDTSSMISEWLVSHPEDFATRLISAGNAAKSGNSASAINQYQKILQEEPEQLEALNNVAWLLHEKGEAADAAKYAKHAYELMPNSPSICDTYGYILLEAGQTDQALVLLRKAVELAPDNPANRYHLALALLKLEQKHDAIKELEISTASSQLHPESENAKKLLERLRY